ncbi:MAG: YggT family protein [Butyricicoccus sp.]
MIYLVYRLLFSLIRLMEFLLVVRALVSWFPQVQQSQLGDFVYTVTEPLVRPCRELLSRIQALRSMPIDFSALMAFVILEVLENLLRGIFF